ncbi:MAG: DUF169 domain-containing protein [Thermaerobacter sp.]|nr:DUF169 domain-containing protein [Thermaerobacter sp.]
MEPKELAQAIDRYVRPETFPLALRVLQREEEIPQKARLPHRDLGIQVSICQGISMARRYGWTIAMSGEDLSCPIAQVAFAFREAPPFYAEGNLAKGMYAKDADGARRTERVVARAEVAGTVVVAPLSRAEFVPEVVAVYGNSAQVMRMVAAALFDKGGSIISEFSARADCAEIVNRTRQTHKPQVILPCYGDRVFGQTQDHEMAFTFPWEDAESFRAGLEGTHQGGVRYPIPHYLRYTADYPATYETVKAIWREEDEEGGAGG